MKQLKLSLAVLCTGFLLASSYAHAENNELVLGSKKEIREAPEVHGLVKHEHTYKMLYRILKPVKCELKTLLDAVVMGGNETTYEALYNYCVSLQAQAGLSGRMMVTLPDGTVVLDTSKPTDFTDATPSIYANSYAHFLAKTVNENHNSRIAILDSQLWPYGVGVEIKYSTTNQNSEQYVAVRLGDYLNSSGSARLSITITP